MARSFGPVSRTYPLTYDAPDPNGPGGAGNLNDYLLAGTDATP